MPSGPNMLALVVTSDIMGSDDRALAICCRRVAGDRRHGVIGRRSALAVDAAVPVEGKPAGAVGLRGHGVGEDVGLGLVGRRGAAHDHRRLQDRRRADRDRPGYGQAWCTCVAAMPGPGIHPQRGRHGVGEHHRGGDEAIVKRRRTSHGVAPVIWITWPWNSRARRGGDAAPLALAEGVEGKV